MSIKVIFDLWDKFWFSEGSPLIVAVFRILYGLLLLAFIALLTPDMFIWFGHFGIVSTQSVRDFNKDVLLNLLNICRDNDLFLVAFFTIFFMASVCLTIGYKTKLATVIVYLALTSLYHRNQLLFNSGDTYMRVCAFWLMFAPTGKALSIDHLLSKKDDSTAYPAFTYKPVSLWSLRLLQLQLTLVYCHTFFAKAPGSVWVEGTAVYYSSRIEDLTRISLPYVFEHLWTIYFLSYSTLVIELALWTLIWFKEFRYIIIFIAIIFHLTIDLHMNIPLFEWMMIASYSLFVYEADMRKILTAITNRLPWLKSKVLSNQI